MNIKDIHPRFYLTVKGLSDWSVSKSAGHIFVQLGRVVFTTQPKAGSGFWDRIWN